MDHAYEVAVKDSVFRGTPFTENDCPHDRDPDRCDAAVERYEASKYPSLVSPHAIQRGSFIHWLRNDVPQPAISDRANVSAAILDAHYDERNKQEKNGTTPRVPGRHLIPINSTVRISSC